MNTPKHHHHIEEWKSLFEKGIGSRDIAKQYGCSRNTVIRVLKKHGVDVSVQKPGTIEQNYLDKEWVRKRTTINVISGCWEWQVSLTRKGYGVFTLKGKPMLAHRHSYFIFKGDPAGLFVCHTCDNPKCVNPDHLFLGTTKDNAIDMMEKDRGTSRLSKEVVKGIRLQLKTNTHKDLAEKYNVSQSAIARISRKESWSWLAE